MTDDLLKMLVDDTVEKMTAAVAHSRREFATVRTGRASSSLVERLTVEAYGVEMRMQELASFQYPRPDSCSSPPMTQRTCQLSNAPLTRRTWAWFLVPTGEPSDWLFLS